MFTIHSFIAKDYIRLKHVYEKLNALLFNTTFSFLKLKNLQKLRINSNEFHQKYSYSLQHV